MFLGDERLATITGTSEETGRSFQPIALKLGTNTKVLRVRPDDKSARAVFGLGDDPAIRSVKTVRSQRIRPESEISIGVEYKVESTASRVRMIRGKVASLSQPLGDVTFIHTDHVKSVALMTAGTGTLISGVSYYPYGAIRVRSPNSAGRYWFNGKELDEESGLYYFGARYYDPRIGQFASADPVYLDADRWYNVPNTSEESKRFFVFLENPQRNNLYSYALRNPIRFIDPYGQDSIDTVQLVLTGVGFVPGPVGQIANLTNACICAYRGDYLGAGLLTLAAASGFKLPIATGRAAVAAEEAINAANQATSIESGFTASVSWGRSETLAGHFGRHGAGIGAETAEEYASEASRFFQRSQAEGLPTKIAPDGTIRVYDPLTNRFGSFNPDGTTKTFFSPKSPEYFERPQNIGSEPWMPSNK